MRDNDTEYAREKFGTAISLMTGPEEFSRRVAKGWTEIAGLEETYEFESEELQHDFDWLMSKRAQFAVGDGAQAKATAEECDQVRHRIMKIHALLG